MAADTKDLDANAIKGTGDSNENSNNMANRFLYIFYLLKRNFASVGNYLLWFPLKSFGAIGTYQKIVIYIILRCFFVT